MKKNTRVQMKGTKDKGTVVETVVKWGGVSKDEYVSVLFDSEEYEVSVRIDALEEI